MIYRCHHYICEDLTLFCFLWKICHFFILLFVPWQDSAAGEITPTADQAVMPQAAVVPQKVPLDSTNEEEEPAQDIEMPPPMAIQDHSFKPEKEVSTDDVSAKLVSVTTLFLEKM